MTALAKPAAGPWLCWERTIGRQTGMRRALDSAQSAGGPIGSLTKLIWGGILNQRIVEMAGRHGSGFSIPVSPELERRWPAGGGFPGTDPELIRIAQAEPA